MGSNISKKFSAQDINNSYVIKEKLGTGSFAVVKKAVKKSNGNEVAVKIIDKQKLEKAELDSLNDEVEILQKLDHPNIVKLFEIYDSKKRLYMVLEYLTGGELFERIVEQGSFNEKQAAKVIAECVR